MSQRPDKLTATAALSTFQRATVKHAVERLLDPGGSRRFLVADEVGLGKTLVARGVVAEVIDRLWESVNRVDILYVCSNAALARENLPKLRGTTLGSVIPATRFTLLPREAARFHEKLNFISLTPETAMRTSGTGQQDERLILFDLLRQALYPGRSFNQVGAWLGNLLRGTVGPERWRQRLQEARELDPSLCKKFVSRFNESGALGGRVAEMEPVFARIDSVAARERSTEASRLVGDLRRLLATVCIDTVEPDLIILDEFQRFKELLVQSGDELSSEAELAQQLFGYRTPEGNQVALLLLSATPYRMFTSDAGLEAEDHYEDFLDTTRFLLNDEAKVGRLKTTLGQYRTNLTRAAGGASHDLGAIKSDLQTQLLGVMCRRERVGSTVDRDAMVVEPRATTHIAPSDVAQFLTLERVRAHLDTHDLVELWKSAPYLLNFAKKYQFKQRLEEKASTSGLREAIAHDPTTQLHPAQISGYEALDPGSGRLRLLAEHSLGQDCWKMLWLPPSFPYWPLAEPWRSNRTFTKKLLFSSWDVVPDTVSALISYEAELRMVGDEARSREVAYEGYFRARSGRLQFSVKGGEPTGMTTLALEIPCLALADIHPLALEGDVREAMLAHVRDLLAGLDPDPSARVDTRWYWAALLLLDRDREISSFLDGLVDGTDAAAEQDEDDAVDEEMARDPRQGRKGLRLHAERARSVLAGETRLGAFPADLADVLVNFALGGPAILWARTLTGLGVTDTKRRRELASQLANAVRSLFNEPHVRTMLRADEEGTYWGVALRYAAEGNLQAVLDEYAHQLWESKAWSGDSSEEIAAAVTHAAASAITTKTSRIRPDYLNVRPRSVEVVKDGPSIRTHYALRYGGVRSGDHGDGAREDAVRDAFKSPFYPFVLASTSVGQEGLDFHPWCHAIWHWNLPGNPVDLEQREGRVHRYKGHAIRKNVADTHGAALRGRWTPGQDPWAVLFKLAEEARPPGESELVPCWLAPGPHKVERWVPMLPLSREVAQLERLKKSLALYRVVFGQPRQEELVTLLARSDIPREQIDSWILSLEPPALGCRFPFRNAEALEDGEPVHGPSGEQGDAAAPAAQYDEVHAPRVEVFERSVETLGILIERSRDPRPLQDPIGADLAKLRFDATEEPAHLVARHGGLSTLAAFSPLHTLEQLDQVEGPALDVHEERASVSAAKAPVDVPVPRARQHLKLRAGLLREACGRHQLREGLVVLVLQPEATHPSRELRIGKEANRAGSRQNEVGHRRPDVRPVDLPGVRQAERQTELVLPPSGDSVEETTRPRQRHRQRAERPPGEVFRLAVRGHVRSEELNEPSRSSDHLGGETLDEHRRAAKTAHRNQHPSRLVRAPNSAGSRARSHRAKVSGTGKGPRRARRPSRSCPFPTRTPSRRAVLARPRLPRPDRLTIPPAAATPPS